MADNILAGGWTPTSVATPGVGGTNNASGWAPAPATATATSVSGPSGIGVASGGGDGWQNTSGTATANGVGTSSLGGLGYAPSPPTATATSVNPPNNGSAIYGANGNQTLGDFQKWQSDEFNKNQLAGQQAFNGALGQMPYNTQVNATNPYDQYVANPATPGKASGAFQSPENASAWQNSGLSSQLANPGSTFTQGQGNNQYQNNQLLFLMNALQRFGAGGQNRFGNGFSPIFTQSNLNGLGNSSQNPGGYQSGNNGSNNNLGLAQLLPLLIGLGQQQNGGPAAGSYGNLGVQNGGTVTGGPQQVSNSFYQDRLNSLLAQQY